MQKYIFILYCWLLSSACITAQSDNPFLDLVGKTYGEYHDRYVQVRNSLFEEGPQKDHQQLLRLLKQAADADKTGEWELNRHLDAIHVELYNRRNGGFVFDGERDAGGFAANFLRIAETAGRKGFPLVRLRAMFDAANCYRIFAQNNERAFSIHNELAAELSAIPTVDFPIKLWIYREIANLYYSFHEYDDAETYYRLIKDDPASRGNYYRSYYPGLHGLGVCYRYGKADFVRSDSCFYALLDDLQDDIEQAREVFTGIAHGCLGINCYMQEKYDEAYPLFLAASAEIARPNDYSFLSEVHTYLADICLRRKEIDAAGRHISTAVDLHVRTGLPDMPPQLYSVRSKYMAYAGCPEQAAILFDSTLIATARQSEAFSGLVLRRIEQQLREADSLIHRQETSFYRLVVTIICIVLVILSIMLALIGYFYRKKRLAYHELVRQNQKWAGITVNETEDDPAGEEERAPGLPAVAPSGDPSGEPSPEESDPTELDRTIMETIGKVITEGELYRRDDFSLDALVEITGHNRYYISGALNRCTGRNFHTYVNEFRIKEVIRILSDPAANMTVVDIAYDTGFNDRKSLYRVFRKITGLSLPDFRKNMDGHAP